MTSQDSDQGTYAHTLKNSVENERKNKFKCCPSLSELERTTESQLQYTVANPLRTMSESRRVYFGGGTDGDDGDGPGQRPFHGSNLIANVDASRLKAA
jgi:hypothetical protein